MNQDKRNELQGMQITVKRRPNITQPSLPTFIKREIIDELVKFIESIDKLHAL